MTTYVQYYSGNTPIAEINKEGNRFDAIVFHGNKILRFERIRDAQRWILSNVVFDHNEIREENHSSGLVTLLKVNRVIRLKQTATEFEKE